MIKLIALAINATLISNIILTKFLGICPFMGVSKRQSTAVGMGLAVTFVLTLAVVVTWALEQYALRPMGLEYLRTIVFILVIASLVQFVEIFLKKSAPALYQALGIYLPLITTNCAILGSAIIVVQNEYTFWEGVTFAFFTALGFTLVIVAFSAIREALEMQPVPRVFKGVPIAFITAGIMSLAFMGFSGLDKSIEKVAYAMETKSTRKVVSVEKQEEISKLALKEKAIEEESKSSVKDSTRNLKGNVKERMYIISPLRDGLVKITLLSVENFPVSVTLKFSQKPSEKELDRIAGEFNRALLSLSDVFNNYDPNSEVTKLSRAPVGEEIEVSMELYKALSIAKELWRESEGLFDVTVEPLARAWKSKKKPSEEDISKLRSLVGYDKVKLLKGNKVLKEAEREFELGGLKGIFADYLLAAADEIGASPVVIDAGGDLRINSQEPISVGVANPENPSEPLLRLKLTSCGVATSGFYYRGHHIINPKTGYPIKTDLLSATAIVFPESKSGDYLGAWADGYATILLLLGREKAKKFVRDHGISAILIWREGDKLVVWATSDLKDKLEVNPKYKDVVKITFE